MVFNYIVVILVGYLVGSIPFSYLAARMSDGIDLRHSGTGNLGAMNSYESTGKKWVGVVVFILDFLKGTAVALFARSFAYGIFAPVAAASLAVIIGHNHSVFMKFRGGRGLSAAAGALLQINPFALILWVVMWLTGYFVIKKNVHVANITASLMTPILVTTAPVNAIKHFNMMDVWWVSEYRIFIALGCILLLAGHSEVISEWLKALKEKS